MQRKNNKKRKLNPIFSAPKFSNISSHFNPSVPSHCCTITFLVRSLFLPFSICSGPFSQCFVFLRWMNSTTAWHPSVDTALFMLIHSITPPLIARPVITAPHPPSLPLEGPWVTVRILVVLVCLPSHILRKCSNFVPLMECWEGLCMDCSWLWFINRHPSALRASYGTPDPSPCEVQPHHTFSDASYLSVFSLSTVTNLPGISGRSSTFGTIRPPQYELQPQSAIPGDPHLSDPATSRVTHPSVIPLPLKPGKSALGTRLP